MDRNLTCSRLRAVSFAVARNDAAGRRGHVVALSFLRDQKCIGAEVKAFCAREAQHQFDRLIDTARAEHVVVEKHGRPVVVVIAIEEYERLIDRKTQSAGANEPEDIR